MIKTHAHITDKDLSKICDADALDIFHDQPVFDTIMEVLGFHLEIILELKTEFMKKHPLVHLKGTHEAVDGPLPDDVILGQGLASFHRQELAGDQFVIFWQDFGVLNIGIFQETDG